MSNEYGLRSEGKKLQDAFWKTRVEAIAAYKKMNNVDPADFEKFANMQDKYIRAWEKYSKANMKYFLWECEQ